MRFNAQAASVGDFNLDGKMDMAVTNNGSSNASIQLGNGDDTFTAAPSIAGFAVPRGLAVGDFNRDGLPDLAVADYAGANITILLGNGNGKFVRSASIPAGSLAWPDRRRGLQRRWKAGCGSC